MSGMFHSNLHRNSLSSRDSLNKKFSFPFYTAFLICVSILSYAFDVGSDLVMMYFLYKNGHKLHFGLTACFIFIPAFAVMLHNLRTYMVNREEEPYTQFSLFGWTIRIASNLFLLGPVVRYIDMFRYGLKCRRAQDLEMKKKFLNWMIQEDGVVSHLRVIECFMESAPQLTLQIYVLAQLDGTKDPTTVIVQILSCIFSLLSLSSCMPNLERTFRDRSGFRQLTLHATVVQFMWYLFVTASRLLSVGLFSSYSPVALAVIFAVRWIITLMFKSYEDFHTKSVINCCDIFLTCLWCFISLFICDRFWCTTTMFKWHVIIYHSSIFVENAILINVWYCSVDTHIKYRMAAIPTVILTFFIGIIFLP